MALCWCMSPVMVALETQRLERKVSGMWNSARSQSADKKYEGRERELFLLPTSLRAVPTMSTLGTGWFSVNNCDTNINS